MKRRGRDRRVSSRLARIAQHRWGAPNRSRPRALLSPLDRRAPGRPSKRPSRATARANSSEALVPDLPCRQQAPPLRRELLCRTPVARPPAAPRTTTHAPRSRVMTGANSAEACHRVASAARSALVISPSRRLGGTAERPRRAYEPWGRAPSAATGRGRSAERGHASPPCYASPASTKRQEFE
jgi:hypothetical protein